jgi:hypothetical protein
VCPYEPGGTGCRSYLQDPWGRPTQALEELCAQPTQLPTSLGLAERACYDITRRELFGQLGEELDPGTKGALSRKCPARGRRWILAFQLWSRVRETHPQLPEQPGHLRPRFWTPWVTHLGSGPTSS